MNRSNKNQTVWAKLRYCSYWPAFIVENPPPMLKEKMPKRKLCVFFFGSHNFGFVSVENVQPFLQFKSKYMKKCSSQLFKQALNEADDYMNNDSNVDYPTAENVLNNERIVIKSELEGAMMEDHSDEICYKQEIHIKSKSNKCDDCRAKQILIDELNCELKTVSTNLVSSKTDHQQLFIDNTKKDHEIKELQAGKTSLEHQLVDLNQKLKYKDEELDNLATEKTRLEEELQETQRNQNIYEVEKIIQHKMKRGKLVYLIRWKGYESDADDWVLEENVFCDKILHRYKKLHSL